MKKFQKLALIIYKKSKEEKFRKIYNKWLNLSKFKKGTSILGHCVPLKDNWKLEVIKDVFGTYRDFDNFLYSIAEEIGDDKDIIVLGHDDEQGYFWADYPQKNQLNSEKLQ